MAAALTDLDDREQADANTRSARQILLQATLLGLLADNMLRTAEDGLGWAIWIAALALAAVFVVRYRDERLGLERAAWLGTAVTFAAFMAWRAEGSLWPANILATLVALAMFSMVSARQPAASILASRLRDVIAAGFFAARDAMIGVLALLFRDADLGSALRSSASARRPAIRAAIITVPLFVLFTALLSRADPVFGSIFRLPRIDAEDVISHVVLAGFFAWSSAGWMRGALLPAHRFALPDRVPIRLGTVEITAALGAVLGLFAVFVAIQLRWLFGGADVVQATTGLSVAEYARRGFFELVAVAALVLPLVLGTRAAIDDEAVIRRHTRLSVALLVLLAAIMASAMLRMRLYVENFGLTTDRLFALTFMLWLAVVFGAMAVTLLRGWGRPFAAMTVISGFIALVTLNVVNPDVVVARVNLARRSALPVDYEYLSRLSADAAVVVTPALADAAPSDAACKAAKRLRLRALHNDAASNLGKYRGREAVLSRLTPGRVQQLCLLEAGAVP